MSLLYTPSVDNSYSASTLSRSLPHAAFRAGASAPRAGPRAVEGQGWGRTAARPGGSMGRIGASARRSATTPQSTAMVRWYAKLRTKDRLSHAGPGRALPRGAARRAAVRSGGLSAARGRGARPRFRGGGRGAEGRSLRVDDLRDVRERVVDRVVDAVPCRPGLRGAAALSEGTSSVSAECVVESRDGNHLEKNKKETVAEQRPVVGDQALKLLVNRLCPEMAKWKPALTGPGRRGRTCRWTGPRDGRGTRCSPTPTQACARSLRRVTPRMTPHMPRHVTTEAAA
jgi:hypothetical protein